MTRRGTNALWLIVGMALLAVEGWTCTVSGVISNVDMVKTADSVVRARAIEYANRHAIPPFRRRACLIQGFALR
jgi:hypothetical protein